MPKWTPSLPAMHADRTDENGRRLVAQSAIALSLRFWLNAKNLRGFGGLVPHESPHVSDFQFFTFRNSNDHALLHFALNQNKSQELSWHQTGL
jgi:hypothetical protein